MWYNLTANSFRSDSINAAGYNTHTKKKQFNTKRDNFYWEHDVNVHFKQHYIQKGGGGENINVRSLFIYKKKKTK